MAKTARVRLLRHVTGEKPDAQNPDNGLETLSKGSVVDVSEGFATELVGSKSAEYVEDKTKLSTAELTHVPDVPAAPSPVDGLAEAIAAGVAQALASLKK